MLHQKKKLTTLFTALIFLLISLPSLSETITMKNGKVYKGTIKEEKKGIIIFLQNNTRKELKLKRADIRSIEQDEKKDVVKKGQKNDWVSLLQPRIGLYVPSKITLGELSDSAPIGIGAHIFSDLKIPLPTQVINLRTGLDLGYNYFATPLLNSSMHFIPIIGRAILSFPLKIGLEPYLAIGGGLNIVLLAADSVDPASSSLDGLLSISAGVTYSHVKMKNIEVIFDVGYFASFQSTIGNFLQINLGVAYRFGRTQKAENNQDNK